MTTRVTTLDKLRVPLGGQEIELQQRDYEAGGMPMLRTRIREKSRFTVFEIDAQTAEAWGRALLRWAQEQGSVSRLREKAGEEGGVVPDAGPHPDPLPQAGEGGRR